MRVEQWQVNSSFLIKKRSETPTRTQPIAFIPRAGAASLGMANLCQGQEGQDSAPAWMWRGDPTTQIGGGGFANVHLP